MSATTRGNRPGIQPAASTAGPLDDAAVTSERVRAQNNREAANIEEARQRITDNQDEVAQDARRRAAANSAFDDQQKFHEQLSNSTPGARPTIILDAATLREQRIAQSKQIAKDLQLDKTVPGGYYIVNGVAVDANGKAIPQADPEAARAPEPVKPPVNTDPNANTGGSGASGNTNPQSGTGTAGDAS